MQSYRRSSRAPSMALNAEMKKSMRSRSVFIGVWYRKRGRTRVIRLTSMQLWLLDWRLAHDCLTRRSRMILQSLVSNAQERAVSWPNE